MKIIKFEFSVGTRYINSTVKKKVELDFDDDATREEIDTMVEQDWIDWRAEQCEGGWKVLSERTVNDEDDE